MDNMQDPKEEVKFTKTYQEASYREQEMKSSSLSFVIVGIILLAIAVMVYLDIIPVAVDSMATKLLDMGVLLVITVIFFFVAFFSMKRAKQLEASSAEEIRQTEEIIEYCTANYEDPAKEDSSETDQYFERESHLRQMILTQYPDLSDSYLDYLVEIVYSELYPSEESDS